MRAMRAIRTTVVYVPTCQKRANFLFLRANEPIKVPTCQRGKGVSIFQLSVPMSQGVPIFQIGVSSWQNTWHFFNFSCQNVRQLFNNFSKELYFLYTKYIYT